MKKPKEVHDSLLNYNYKQNFAYTILYELFLAIDNIKVMRRCVDEQQICLKFILEDNELNLSS